AAGTTSLTYDNASRVTSLVNPFSETTSWVYDAASRVTRQNFGNGAYETYSYDTRSRLTSVVLKNSGGATLSSHSYRYDGFGMPVSSSGAWAGPFGYGGKFGYQSDPDSGLMLCPDARSGSDQGREELVCVLREQPGEPGRRRRARWPYH
ncbi:MAG: hypothetical protein DWB60_06175, partial [Armatimonadetes bacterium]|nr:hypothetical protein [Armatimonadota bacterium]